MTYLSSTSPVDPSATSDHATNLDPLRESFSNVDPLPEDIAREAYARYVERGCEDGHDLNDWLEAERSLRERRSIAPALD